MSKFVKGLTSMFGGSGRAQRMEKMNQITAQAQATETQKLAQERQVQELQNQQAEQETEISRARKTNRGRRLLLAATGEDGVQKTTVG